jgi:cell division protein FtsZ
MMIEAGIPGVDFVVVDTDHEMLESCRAPKRIQIGKTITNGQSAGADPNVGRSAAIESAQEVGEVLRGSEIVFLTAGMGGGTGTGATPAIARTARKLGALAVGLISKPFMFEGEQRQQNAAGGVSALAESADAFVVASNERSLWIGSESPTLRESVTRVDEAFLTAVRCVAGPVTLAGLINMDVADVRTIMAGAGRAFIGYGTANGENCARDAVEKAIASPLLEQRAIIGATGILVDINGSPDLTLAEVSEACTLIQEAANPDANIIFGSTTDPSTTSGIRVSVIATGFKL